MSIRTVRERCEATVATLPLRTPFSVAELARDLAKQRGRPIHLHRQPQRGGPCGVLMSLATADHVFYDGATTALHRQHIVLHELGHLLFEHEGLPLGDEVMRRLITTLDLSTVRKVLGRSSYADEDEAEAELFATLVVERVARMARLAAASPAASSDAVVGRLAVALAAPARA